MERCIQRNRVGDNNDIKGAEEIGCNILKIKNAPERITSQNPAQNKGFDY